jgi:hypothetical protein
LRGLRVNVFNSCRYRTAKVLDAHGRFEREERRMPELDAASGTVPLPLWAAGALLLLLAAICIAALRRSGTPGSVAAFFGVPALVIIAWSGWSFVDHSRLRERNMERQALDNRLLQLTASAMTPGSALACLDASAGEAVEASCERAVFVRPEAVAAAIAYVEARLRLLSDGLDYARRADRGYHAALAGLRRAVEADRFGFVAHVLATRDGCTAERCEAFGLLRDAAAVRANLHARTYDKAVARYAAGWTERTDSTPAAARPAPATSEAAGVLVPTTTAVTRSIDFPSATSIPPISIMNSETNTNAAATAEVAPASPPAASAARRPAATGNASPSVQNAPWAPPAGSANTPRTP